MNINYTDPAQIDITNTQLTDTTYTPIQCDPIIKNNKSSDCITGVVFGIIIFAISITLAIILCKYYVFAD